jgi:serine/threonine protein kinase
LILKSDTRPRVYIIDFESAVEFDINTKLEDCLIGGLPFPDDVYERPRAPEFSESGRPHCPFKSDIWQFGSGFNCFRVSVLVFDPVLVARLMPMMRLLKTTIPGIDEILQSLTETEPSSRPTAREASEKLRRVLRTLPPSALEISPAHVTSH